MTQLVRTAWAAWLAWVLLATPALASDAYSLDSVLIVPFRPESDLLRVDAENVADLIETQLSNQHLVMPLRDVPEFGEGYDAYTYMQACPAGKYAGCAFVVAGRGGVDWAISGEVTEIKDDGLEADAAADTGHLRVSVWFIDVSESEVLLTFSVTLTGDNDADFAKGVEGVFQRVLAGEAEAVDVRGTPEDLMAQVQLEKAKMDMHAAALQDLEETEGEAERAEIGRAGRKKLSKEEVALMSTGDDIVPWQRYQMSPDEYRRWFNSGRSLNDWREMAKGRSGQLIFRVGFGAGSGPYEQYFEARTVNAVNSLGQFGVVEVSEFSEVINGSSTMINLEGGMGLGPVVDLTGFVAFRTAKYRSLFDKKTFDDPFYVPSKENPPILRQTSEFGARLTLAPLPTSMARPTLTTGLAVWRGTPVTKVADPTALQDIKALSAPSLLQLQIAPGGEISLADTFNLYARGNLMLPVGGKTRFTYHEGIEDFGEPNPSGARKPGVGIEAGVMFRFGVFEGNAKKSKKNPLFEEEADGL